MLPTSARLRSIRHPTSRPRTRPASACSGSAVWNWLNKFFEKEKDVVYDKQTYAQYYKVAHYTPAKNEYLPLPYNQLYYVPGLYTQNKGYN